MLNTNDFSQRLQQIMDYYGLTAAVFADTLEIQRSGLSHLLSERNKPSLEFILKLLDKFPEVDFNWITLGKGVFPKPKKNEVTNVKKEYFQADLFSMIDEKKEVTGVKNEKTDTAPVFEAEKSKTEEPKITPKKEITRIIFFYTDKSFEIFENL